MQNILSGVCVSQDCGREPRRPLWSYHCSCGKSHNNQPFSVIQRGRTTVTRQQWHLFGIGSKQHSIVESAPPGLPPPRNLFYVHTRVMPTWLKTRAQVHRAWSTTTQQYYKKSGSLHLAMYFFHCRLLLFINFNIFGNITVFVILISSGKLYAFVVEG